MLPVLENPDFRKRALPLSVEAWHGLIAANLAPKRSELIHGVIIEKMSKSFLHTRLSAMLLETLTSTLGQGWWVRKEDSLTFSDSETEPDLSVVPGVPSDYQEHPRSAVLVIGIAVSSISEDRAMASLYASAGVTEYWIVNAAARTVEVHRNPSANGYATCLTVESGETVSCAALPALRVELAGLFA